MKKRPTATVLRCLLTLLLVAAGPPALADRPGEPVQPTDFLQIRQLGGVTLSPDGRQVAYVVRSLEEAPEGSDRQYVYRSHLHLVPLDGSAPPRALTHGEREGSQAAWSPDGRRLAFLRAVDGQPQVFVLPLDGGEAWQLTRAEHGASSPVWSPDGRQIAFASRLPHRTVAADETLSGGEPPPWPHERPGRTPGDTVRGTDPEAEEPTADPDGDLQAIREHLAGNTARSNPRVVTRLNFQGETDLEPELAYTHWHVVEAEPSAEARPVTRGFFSYDGGRWDPGGAAWAPDGRSLLVVGKRDEATHPDRVQDRDLLRVFLEDGRVETFLDLDGHRVFQPRLSRDGRQVAFLARRLDDPTYRQTVVGVVPLAGGEARILTEELDRSAGNLAWSPDGGQLYFVAPSNGGFPLFRVPAGGGPVERLTGFDSGIRDFVIGPRGLAYVLTEPANPFELYAARADATRPRRLSGHNATWLAGRRISLPEARRLTRPGGLEVDYWVMRPVPFEEGKTYPLLLQIHGGPMAMWGPGEATMWHELQMFAARGYGIVYSNPRGSGGYGFDFQRGNYRDWGTGPAGDVLAAIDEVAREPWVDPDRLVVTGGSYAGYLTAWIVGHDHRFRAAVAQRGVYELATFLGEGNAWRLVPEHFGGYPWEEGIRDVLVRESPLTWADRIRTPLLILHGDDDLRTGVIQSEMLFRYLKILERPVEYVRYPGGAHDLSRTGDPEQRLDRLLRLLEFMERHLR